MKKEEKNENEEIVTMKNLSFWFVQTELLYSELL